VRLPKEEAEERARLLLEHMDRQAAVYILEHPFTLRLQKGNLPGEAVQTAVVDWYFFHRLLAASFSRLYERFIHIARTYPDIEEELLERISHEVTQPKAGGRTLLLRQLARALEISDSRLNGSPQSGELRGFIAFYGRLHSAGTFSEVTASQLGSVLAPYARIWSEALKERYGVPDEARLYWEMNSRLDGEESGGGALGTRRENGYLLRRVFEEGLTETRYNWSMEYAAEMAVKLWAYVLRTYVRRFGL
jgi:pyrroloquinoline quinone (PQQ) biosynthesis protein C